MEEPIAVKIVANQLEERFLRSPNPTQLIGQLAMLTQNVKLVNEHELDLDIVISYD